MQKCTSIEGRGLILSWEDFCLSGDTWQSLEMFLIVTAGGGAVLMESSGWSPETLLNILQCTGQPPTTKADPAHMPTVPRLRNPGDKGVQDSSLLSFAVIF